MGISAAIATVASTAMSVIGQEHAAEAAQQGANYNAQIASLQGQINDKNAQAQAQELDFKAQEESTAAGQQNAAAQQKEILDQRATALAISRARSIGAAGGGDISDPTVVNIMGDLQTQGDYKTATDKYNGTEAANNLLDQANLDTYQGGLIRTQGKQQSAIADAAAGGYTAAGKNDLMGGRTKAFSTLISGAGNAVTMYDKYSSGTSIPDLTASGTNSDFDNFLAQ